MIINPLVIFGTYQEQPHLMDPFLREMLGKCIQLISQFNENDKALHFTFKIIHLMTKTRGYKNLTRLMPHTVDDLEPVYEMLKVQDCNDRMVCTLFFNITFRIGKHVTSCCCGSPLSSWFHSASIALKSLVKHH